MGPMNGMIEISVENKTPCVYKIEDWKKLRTQHRIVGELLGNNFRTPSLPLKLLPEEALLLIDRSLARLIVYPKLRSKPNEADEDVYTELQEELLVEQKELHGESRRKQIDRVIDKIVLGKRKKGDQRTQQDIYDEELNKSCVSKEYMLWPIFTQHADAVNGLPCDVPRDELTSQTNNIRIKVFADLWERGYYVTAGDKFGGDFLSYLGDPLNCHAVNIVRCVEDPHKTFHPAEIVAFGRMGNSVKKNAILATIVNERVSYLTLNWIDS